MVLLASLIYHIRIIYLKQNYIITLQVDRAPPSTEEIDLVFFLESFNFLKYILCIAVILMLMKL